MPRTIIPVIRHMARLSTRRMIAQTGKDLPCGPVGGAVVGGAVVAFTGSNWQNSPLNPSGQRQIPRPKGPLSHPMASEWLEGGHDCVQSLLQLSISLVRVSWLVARFKGLKRKVCTILRRGWLRGTSCQ